MLLVAALALPDVTQAAPGNDNFANATSISSATGTIGGSNVNATTETDESEHGAWDTPAHSIWYTWVAPSSEMLDFDTEGSDFDTVLAVYTGTAVGSLTQIVANDDDPYFDHVVHSRVSFTPAVGTTYHVAVDGHNDEQGNVTLNWGPPLDSISGTVSLPGSEVAPVGGLYIDIDAYNQSGSGSAYDTVFIDEGFSSTSYILAMPPDTSANWQVEYYCSGHGYVETGYYADSGTTWDSNLATLLSGGNNHENKNLTLLKTKEEAEEEAFCFPIKTKNGNVAIICL